MTIPPFGSGSLLLYGIPVQQCVKELAEIIRQTKYFYNFALSKHSDKRLVNVIIIHYKFTAFIAIIQIIRNLYFIELTLNKWHPSENYRSSVRQS